MDRVMSHHRGLNKRKSFHLTYYPEQAEVIVNIVIL